VHLGTRQAEKALKNKKCKLIIHASNLSDEQIELFKKYEKTPKYGFQGDNFELGAACGKPFPISMLTIIEPGESDILALVK